MVHRTDLEMAGFGVSSPRCSNLDFNLFETARCILTVNLLRPHDVMNFRHAFDGNPIYCYVNKLALK